MKEGKLAGGVREKEEKCEEKGDYVHPVKSLILSQLLLAHSNQDQIAVHSQPCQGHDRFNEAMSYSLRK